MAKEKKSNLNIEKIPSKSKTTNRTSTADKPNVFGLKKAGRAKAKMISEVAQGLSEVAGHAAGKAAGSYSTKDYEGWWGENGSHEANGNGKGNKKQSNYKGNV